MNSKVNLKRGIFWLLLLFITCIVHNQSCDAQLINAKISDSTSRFPITQYTSFLKTTTPIGIDSVLKNKSFTKASDKAVLVFDYDPYYYWFRIIIDNRQNQSRDLMLLMAPVGMFDGRLFQKTSAGWSEISHAGLRYKFEDRSYQFTHHVFPFESPDNKIDTLFLSVDANNAYKSFAFALLQPKQLKIFENKIYFIFGIIVGLLLLFFVLNVGLAIALKERLHIWYAAYIALLFLVVMKNDHLDQQFLGLDTEFAFRLTPYLTIGSLAIAVLMHVVQNFLKPALEQSKLFRLSIIVKWMVVIIAIAHAIVFFLESHYMTQLILFNWGKLNILSGIAIIIIDCIYCIRKGFRGALFIFFGSLVFMIGSLQRLFFPSTLSFLFPPTTFHIGIVIETFIISIGLIYKYWSEMEFHRKKEEQIQIQTINDISEEIHDNVGQTLAVANMQLNMNLKNESDPLREKVRGSQVLIAQAISDLRHLSRTLKNESAPKGTLSERIDLECQNLREALPIKVIRTIEGDIPELDNRKQGIIIRIVKEAFQNIMKHSNATEVSVLLKFHDKKLTLNIVDNGVGFDLSKAMVNSNGLKNIENRCLIINAQCGIRSKRGEGTEIKILMPV